MLNTHLHIADKQTLRENNKYFPKSMCLIIKFLLNSLLNGTGVRVISIN